MKYIYYFTIISLLLISCESLNPIEVKQVESLGIVKISPLLKGSLEKDSVIISIPTEFEIKINSPFRYLTWHFIGDKKNLWDDAFDYQINEITPLSQLDIYEVFSKKTIRIIKKERKIFISKKAAEALFKKYNNDKSFENLELGETIKLTSYDKFKKGNKVIIEHLKRSNDSINFRVMKGDGSFYYLQKKIVW
jgi:hypothetical protein